MISNLGPEECFRFEGRNSGGAPITSTALYMRHISTEGLSSFTISDIKTSFKNGVYRPIVTTRGATGFSRLHGGASKNIGSWIGNRLPETPREGKLIYFLPENNEANRVSMVVIPEGTRALLGEVGHGYGHQIWVYPNDVKNLRFTSTIELESSKQPPI